MTGWDPNVPVTFFRDKDVIEAVAKKLGGFSITSTVTMTTTHVVCGAPRRTLNALAGSVRGCWLVSPEWVSGFGQGVLASNPRVGVVRGFGQGVLASDPRVSEWVLTGIWNCRNGCNSLTIQHAVDVQHFSSFHCM